MTMPWPKPACSVSFPCGGCFTRGICDQLQWESGYQTAMAASDHFRDELAESKAREEALQATNEELGKDAAAMAGELDRTVETLGGMNDLVVRLEGELAEARRLLSGYDGASGEEKTWGEWNMARKEFLAAPSPAESTGVPQRPTIAQLEAILAQDESKLRIEINPDGSVRAVNAAAPPDDIRERLAKLENPVRSVESASGSLFTVERDNRQRVDAEHDHRLVKLEEFARGLWPDIVSAPAAPQEQAGRCQRMVDDRQCTARAGHEDGCRHMQVEVPVWVVPTKPHRFAPQRRHRGIPINLCDECAHEESHPIHTGAKP